MIIIIKRKKAEAAEEQKDIKELSSAGEKKQIIKKSLSNFFKGIKEKIKLKGSKKEADYKELEREIQSLGTTQKKKSQK